ncbi:hypothetical protein V6N11_058498 [Hibiscus sabdariffa]|uniref:Uncharacterized protein n=1 Tax=Hibiscus sabdariffa TaxID=183260 RepID=A0ABR2U4Q1_9ROSI
MNIKEHIKGWSSKKKLGMDRTKNVKGTIKVRLPTVVGLPIGRSVCVGRARPVASMSETNSKGVSKCYGTVLGTEEKCEKLF